MTTAPVGTKTPRDQWGNPLIREVPGERLVRYARPSGLGKLLDDQTTLTNWKLRTAGQQIATKAHLRAKMVAAADDKRAGNLVISEALDLADTKGPAALGNLLHDFVLGDRAVDLPEEFALDVAAYDETLAQHGLRVIVTEQFRADRSRRVAGSIDAILERDGHYWPADVKTGLGQWESTKFGSTALGVQLAAYANAVPYADEVFTPDPFDIDRTEGILIQLPAGLHECRLYAVDLVTGVRNLDLALRVKASRSDAADLSSWF